MPGWLPGQMSGQLIAVLSETVVHRGCTSGRLDSSQTSRRQPVFYIKVMMHQFVFTEDSWQHVSLQQLKHSTVERDFSISFVAEYDSQGWNRMLILTTTSQATGRMHL